MEKRKELIVSAIENGTVIDHLPCSAVLQVIKILNLEDYTDQLLIGTNLESRKFGTKGIIKVKNKFFEKSDINKIALVAPKASLIIIKNYEVVEKFDVEIPENIEHMVKCVNPNCITNVEQVPTKFSIMNKEDLILKCHYCEKHTAKANFKFI